MYIVADLKWNNGLISVFRSYNVDIATTNVLEVDIDAHITSGIKNLLRAMTKEWWNSDSYKFWGQKKGGSRIVDMGVDSYSEGRGFEYVHCILDGHFFTYLFVVKIVMFGWKRWK